MSIAGPGAFVPFISFMLCICVQTIYPCPPFFTLSLPVIKLYNIPCGGTVDDFLSVYMYVFTYISELTFLLKRILHVTCRCIVISSTGPHSFATYGLENYFYRLIRLYCYLFEQTSSVKVILCFRLTIKLLLLFLVEFKL